MGSDAIKIITESDIKDKVVRFASILGLVVTGSVTAQYVNFGITWQYVSGEMTKGVQGVLDGIFPGILPLLLTLICWYMMDKKKVGLGKLFAVVFVIAFVGTFFGLIG